MVLIKTLMKLKPETYEAARKKGGVGCPFNRRHGGLMGRMQPYKNGEDAAERYCKKLCGPIYPKALTEDNYRGIHCPCNVYSSSSYVKQKFWKVLNAAKRGI